MFVSKRTRTDFEEWRLEQEWTASKYAAWERGEKVLAPAKRTTAALREGRSRRQQEPSGDREADGNSGIRQRDSHGRSPCEAALMLALSRPFVHDLQRRSMVSALLTSDSTGPSAFR